MHTFPYMENTYTEDKTICFKSVSDTDLVDYAVFEMEAARRKYMLLLKRYAEERKYRE